MAPARPELALVSSYPPLSQRISGVGAYDLNSQTTSSSTS